VSRIRSCYIKFAAVRPGPAAPSLFRQLIDCCQDLAADRGATILTAGVNLGREQAASALSDYGFKTQMLGVAMHRPNRTVSKVPGVFVLTIGAEETTSPQHADRRGAKPQAIGSCSSRREA